MYALRHCQDCGVAADEDRCWFCHKPMPDKARTLSMAHYAAWHYQHGRQIVHSLVGTMYAQPAPGRPGPFLDLPEPATSL